jgi:hypothetical protein
MKITTTLLYSQKRILNIVGFIWTTISALFFIFVILATIVLSGSPEAANAWWVTYIVNFFTDFGMV